MFLFYYAPILTTSILLLKLMVLKNSSEGNGVKEGKEGKDH